MATKAKINHNNYRKALVSRFQEKRIQLRAKSVDQKLSIEDRMQARRDLTKLPRNSSEIRVRNRCEITGRPRGNYRKFGICRIKFREMALEGLIPGVTKSSW